MNLFNINLKDLTVANLQTIRHYVADLRAKADEHLEKPDPKAEALFYKAALFQEELNISYNQRQIKLDSSGMSHASRNTVIEVEKVTQKTLKETIARLQKELPGFKTAFAKAKLHYLSG